MNPDPCDCVAVSKGQIGLFFLQGFSANCEGLYCC